jgi:hypothetical protein
VTFFVAFSSNLCSKFVETRLWLEQMTASYYLVALNQHRSPFFHALARFRSFSRTTSIVTMSTAPTTGTFSTLPCERNTILANAASTHSACRTNLVTRLGLLQTTANVTILTHPLATSPLHALHRALPVGATDKLYRFDCSFISETCTCRVHVRPVLPCQGLLLPLTAK